MAVYELIAAADEGRTAAADPNHKALPVVAVGDDDALRSAHSDLEKGADKSIAPPDKVEFAPLKRAPRLVSLDVFRGLTVALMIFVDNAGSNFPAINHSPWDGVALADFVMPFFLFIVGLALAVTYKPQIKLWQLKSDTSSNKALCSWSCSSSGYFHGLYDLTYGVDILRIRWMGVLQRIAIAYLLAAICEIWLKGDQDVHSGFSFVQLYGLQLLVGLALTTIYLVLLYGLYVPDWEYQIPVAGFSLKTFSVKCAVRGDTGPACNAAGMIDRRVFGIQHLHRHPVYGRMEQCSINSPASGPLPPHAPSWCQAPFDPEGLLSSMMAIVTCLIGLQFGHIIIHFKDHKERIVQWMIPSFCLLALAFSLDFFGMQMNKALYTPSYTCITAGTAGLMFTAVYVLVDIYGYRKPTLAMEWLGTHALMVYILLGCNIFPLFTQGFYLREPENNIATREDEDFHHIILTWKKVKLCFYFNQWKEMSKGLMNVEEENA